MSKEHGWCWNVGVYSRFVETYWFVGPVLCKPKARVWNNIVRITGLFLWDFMLILNKKRFSVQYNAFNYCAITPRFTNFKLSNLRDKGFRVLIYIISACRINLHWGETTRMFPVLDPFSQRVHYFVLHLLLRAKFLCWYFCFGMILSQSIYSHYCL
jgi:hypothetical protein